MVALEKALRGTKEQFEEERNPFLKLTYFHKRKDEVVTRVLFYSEKYNYIKRTRGKTNNLRWCSLRIPMPRVLVVVDNT
jgi:hypothetical protein